MNAAAEHPSCQVERFKSLSLADFKMSGMTGSTPPLIPRQVNDVAL